MSDFSCFDTSKSGKIFDILWKGKFTNYAINNILKYKIYKSHLVSVLILFF